LTHVRDINPKEESNQLGQKIDATQWFMVEDIVIYQHPVSILPLEYLTPPVVILYTTGTKKNTMQLYFSTPY
jgi:hypothetical protein